MVTEIYSNHNDAHAQNSTHATQNTNIKLRLTRVVEAAGSFLSCAGALVIRIVSHSRLGEPRPICKVWYVKAERVVSFVKPELTTYSLKANFVCPRGLFRS